MSQALSPLNPAFWSTQIGMVQRKSLVGRGICDTRERAKLTVGDTLHRSYTTEMSANAYVKGVDVTINDINPTDETLSVNQQYEVSFYVDDIDDMQNLIDISKEKVNEAAYKLNDQIDTSVMNQVAYAKNILDNEVLTGGATAGTGIAVSASNIHQVVSALKRVLRKANVALAGDTFLVVTPRVAEYIEQYVAANGFSTADATIKNGYAGDFLGVKIFVSNNVNAGSSKVNMLGGKLGSIDLVVQREPKVDITRAEKRFGAYFKTLAVWGVKTFYQGTNQLVKVVGTEASSL